MNRRGFFGRVAALATGAVAAKALPQAEPEPTDSLVPIEFGWHSFPSTVYLSTTAVEITTTNEFFKDSPAYVGELYR